MKIKKIGHNKVIRHDYAKVSSDLRLPNLIDIQLNTFDWFKKKGIQEVFDEIFPIATNDENLILSLDDWEFREPRISAEKAKTESKVFDAPIYSNISLSINLENHQIFKENFEGITDSKKIVKAYLVEQVGDEVKFKSEDKNSLRYEYTSKITGAKPELIEIKIIDETAEYINVSAYLHKQGEVFFGDIPMMTKRGTFIINGSEKVVVSQLVRSPGSYFKHEIDRKTRENKYHADIIPSRGTWLEFEIDVKKISETKPSTWFGVKIDKSKKVNFTKFLTALGFKSGDVIKLFNNNKNVIDSYTQDNLSGDFDKDFSSTITDLYKKIRQDETATAEGAYRYIAALFFDKRKYDLTNAGRFKLNQKLAMRDRIIGRILAETIKDVNGKVLFKKGSEITKDNFPILDEALKAGAMVHKISNSVTILDKDYPGEETKVHKILVYSDNLNKTDESIIPIISICHGITEQHLTNSDIFATISYAMNLVDGIGEEDDIDHLGNRRVRTVGELLQNQLRIGMIRIEKNAKEKLTTSSPFKMRLSNIINNKPLTAVIGEFFNLSQLSQFMDQTNPLAELTNKRRITALGPGGLSRDRAALDVRDVHPSHYGRICPIETPEGPNIGLISNLSTYAEVNEYGFIVTPYRKVKKGRVIENEYEKLTADQEKYFVVAQANINIAEDGTILDKNIVARFKGGDIIVSPEEVDYVDVSPKQIVSIATSCIPFLENDDANRALMGANMQRQAVPLINPDSPIVGTGVEYEAARDSGQAIISGWDGTIEYVDAKKIVINTKKDGKKTEHLNIFERSNSGTSLTHIPIVKIGDSVKKGQILADGPSMDKGELALGQNVVVAFTTWNGYNYEDAIIVSERIVVEDVFTSINIDEYTLEVRQTKQGVEEVTREVPNVSETVKKNLDEQGIVAIGSEVKVGDILIGKVTPKSQTQKSAEDKLLQAIFGEKSKNLKDNSLRVPNGGDGIVQSIKRFAKKDGFDLPSDILEIIKVYVVQKRKIQEGDKMAGRHGNKGVISKILPIEDMPHTKDGTPVDILLNPQGVPSRMNIGQVLEIHLGMAAKKLGIKVSTPVFEGVDEQELLDIMSEAGMSDYGKVELIDGQTGESFDKPIAVGVMYMLKLSHMVDDKIHARNVGPYSLITQQPLGGKAQNGGQRFGEMEVWALEAYGAAYTLREILTIKSDDIKGRIKTYESIVRSKPIPKPGIPESFKVLTREIMGLGFDVNMIYNDGTKMPIKRYEDSDEFVDFEYFEGDESEVFGESTPSDISDDYLDDLSLLINTDEMDISYIDDDDDNND
ncbi:DNA-directed RNA polymerase subunit beta [Spiroplasma endosymbiont of Aspidapion aeneum]|uniref:DNA-directed RNA polymerase subunit beta n=1 Tax=Spiroplasma endosymbiont of Aspidapion aeneum TaxID=3066276 RepID=UPI00313B2D0A